MRVLSLLFVCMFFVILCKGSKRPLFIELAEYIHEIPPEELRLHILTEIMYPFKSVHAIIDLYMQL